MLFTTIYLRRLVIARPTGPSCRVFPRTIHGTCTTPRQPGPPNSVSHSAESYFVDNDDTPPSNTSLYKVDATSDAAESAYEPASGPWSRAGVETKEYRTVSKDEPYDVPSPGDVKLRYGGKERRAEDRSSETSKADEGPEGTGRWGRKPEGRT